MTQPAPLRSEAPAKLNLRLRVLGRRPDGFHEIETHFVKLRLADSLELEPGGDGISIDIDGPAGAALGMPGAAPGMHGVPADETNLCCRAARAWFDAVGRAPALGIRLTKRIPVAAGLGGGSSDAAAVLVALNEAADAYDAEKLPGVELLHLAAGLGSDVPFFVGGAGAALALGRGDRLLALTPPPPRPVLIVVPDFGISAAEAYTWWSEDAGAEGAPSATEDPSPDETAPAATDAHDLSDWDALTHRAVNDLAGPVERRRPALGTVRTALARVGAAPAILCGSGSCVAGIFRAESDRDAATAKLVSEGVIEAGWRTISTWTAAPAD